MSCVVTKNIPTFQQLGFNSKSRLCISVMSSLNSLVVADWMADHPEAVDIITWTGKTFKKYLKISVSIEMFLPENFTNYLDELNLFAKAKVLLPRISKDCINFLSCVHLLCALHV